MTRDGKRRYLEMLSACAVCALTIGPAFGQTTTGPSTKTPGTTESTPTEPRPDNAGDPTKARDTMRGGDMSNKQTRGAQVRRAQEALKTEGHDPGPIDGVMGPRTQAAIRSYQKQENLQETGRLDRETAEKLGLDRLSSRR